MGGLARDLGNTYLRTGVTIHNESALFKVLRYPERKTPPVGLTTEALGETRQWIEAVSARLDGARMEVPDASLIADEYSLTARLLLLACDRAAGVSRGMNERLAEIIVEYRRLWLARNRIGGLADSVKRLEALQT